MYVVASGTRILLTFSSPPYQTPAIIGLFPGIIIIRTATMRPARAKWPKKESISDPRAGAARPPSTMSKEAQLSIAERDFILEALRENVRLDGRQPDDYRPLNISFGEEYGHVNLQLGKTK
jgi:hypothetical protein